MQLVCGFVSRSFRSRHLLNHAPPIRRRMSSSPLVRQYEALEVLVDAVERAKNEMKGDDDNENKKKSSSRKDRRKSKRGSSGPGSGGSGGSSGGNGTSGNKGNRGSESAWGSRTRSTFIRAAETAVIMTSGLAMLGFAGLFYHRAYRYHALNKMENAFDTWDPVLEMSSAHKKLGDNEDWVERPQQKRLDEVVSGKVSGRYWLLLGEKGTGKTSMLLHAVQHVQGHNVVVMDAHSDPEIFRQRLGKALNFEFHEDYWGGLFSLRGPRENTFLDIERVLNVLEEVAVRRFKRLGRPLCVVINNAHMIPESEDGTKVLTLIQQKAESFSGSGIANFVFTCDDFWLYQRLMRAQTRMDSIMITDLHKPEAVRVLKRMRKRITGEDLSPSVCDTIYGLVGGRPQHLAAVANHADMIAAGQRLIDKEKQWFLSCCGLLGSEMDDDVMDSGKFATSGMLLAREFVRMEREDGQIIDPVDGTRSLPRVPLWRARQVMTRPDFIREYDNLNLFTLDAFSRVKPDSQVMMHAFKEIVDFPGFDDLLQATLDRVAAIESLQRTRELTFKDLGGGDSGIKGALVFRNNRIELELPELEEESTQMALDANEKGFFWKQRLHDLKSPPEKQSIAVDPAR